jgi:hypothetical protein
VTISNFFAQSAALGIDGIDYELELLQAGIAAGGECARKRINVADLDGGVGRASARSPRDHSEQ